MITLSLSSPGERLQDIAKRARQRRVDMQLTQAELAARAQIKLGTLRLFEQTGRASLETVLGIAFALRAEAEFAALFPPRPPGSIEDVAQARPRQRVRRR